MNFLPKFLLPGSLLYLLIASLLFFFNDYSISPLVPFLPVVYAMVFALVYEAKKEVFNSLAVFVIFVIWFLRIVIIPFVFVLSGYVSHINVDAGINHLNSATILMSYEFVCVGFLVLLSKKIDIVTKKDYLLHYCNKRMSVFVLLIILLIFAFAVICVIYDKSLLALISSISDKFVHDADLQMERRRELIYAYGNSKLIYSLFFDSIYYLQILIPACLLSFIVQKEANVSRKGLFGSFLIVCGSICITTDNNIDSVVIMLACFYVVALAYKKTMDRFLFPFFVLGVVFIFAFLFRKNGNEIDLSFSSLSLTLCPYFASLPNVSAGFSIIFDNKLETFVGDIISGVPFMTAFFKNFPKTVVLYNEMTHGYSGYVNQIVPLITSGYHYLGFFAPVFTLIVYSIAFKMEQCLKNSKTIFSQVIFVVFVINLSVGPCVFGFPNTIKRLCMFIPLFVLAILNEYKLIKK